MPPSTHIPDLVIDSKLDVECFDNYSIQTKLAPNPVPRQPRIRQKEKWQRTRVLGEGTFGIVWLEKCTAGPSLSELRAVKALKNNNGTITNSTNFYRELEAIAKFSQEKYQDHFVRSLGWYESENAIFITMEYLPLGDLEGYLKTRLSHAEARLIAQQLLEGLEFMHDNKFVHRDLKPAYKNILVIHHAPEWWVKISDFGISKRIEGTELRTVIGTEAYLAPEVRGMYTPDIQDDEEHVVTFSFAVDIWAVGAITFRMITGQLAFPPGPKLFNYVVRGRPFPVDRSMSAECSDFVMKTMTASPYERPSSKQALSLPWILVPVAPSTTNEPNELFENDTKEEFNTAILASASAKWSHLEQGLMNLGFNRHDPAPKIMEKEEKGTEGKKLREEGMQSGSTNSIRPRDFSKDVSSNNERAKSKVPSGAAAKDTNLVGGTSQATLPAIVLSSPNSSSMITTTDTRLPLKLREVLTSKSNIWDFGFSNDGRFAFVDGNGEVNIWNEGRTWQFKTSHKFKSRLIFSPDGGELLLYSDFPLLCEIWKIDGRDLTLAKQFEKPVNGSATKFSPDGRRLAMEVIWKSDLLEKVESDEAFRLANYVTSCEFSPDGRWLVVEYYYHGWAIVILEHDEQGKVNQIQKLVTKHQRSIDAFSPNRTPYGRRTVFDDSLRSEIAFSSNGRLLVLNNKIYLEVWRISKQRKLYKIYKSYVIKQQLEVSLTFNMRNYMLWKRHRAGVQIWKLENEGMREGQKFEGSSGRLHAVIPSPDSRLLALPMTTEKMADQLFHDNLDCIEIWQADKQGDFRHVQNLTVKNCSTFYDRIQFSPDGRWFAFLRGIQNIEIWKVEGGNLKN